MQKQLAKANQIAADCVAIVNPLWERSDVREWIPIGDAISDRGYCVYVMADVRNDGSVRRTYVGSTHDVGHRWRQHARLISGGARATATFARCIPAVVLSGFPDAVTALQYEWRLKHVDGSRRRGASRKGDPWARRQSNIVRLLDLERATHQAVPRNTLHLRLSWVLPPSMSTMKSVRDAQDRFDAHTASTLLLTRTQRSETFSDSLATERSDSGSSSAGE